MFNAGVDPLFNFLQALIDAEFQSNDLSIIRCCLSILLLLSVNSSKIFFFLYLPYFPQNLLIYLLIDFS